MYEGKCLTLQGQMSQKDLLTGRRTKTTAMKRLIRTMLITVFCVMMVACGEDTKLEYGEEWSITTSGSTSATITTDDIEFDYTPLDEDETIPDDDDDYVENATFDSKIAISYSGSTATVTGSVSGVEVTVSGAHVTVNATVSGVEYILSGTSDDGSFKIYSEKKMKITLDGLTLNNPTGAAINDQCGKSMFLVLTEDSENSLSDGSSYTTTDGEDMKGTIFSEGQIIISGEGTLDITANCKNGISSDDYIVLRPGNVININANASNGIKANDYVIVRGGVLNIDVTTAGSKGISSDGHVTVEGGRTTVITSGGVEIEDNDTKSCAGIKADSALNITAGTLKVQSTGQGGKGISSDEDINISGGEITIVTTGAGYVKGSLDSYPKGIKADGNVNISGGTINVNTSGGDGAEGIESKATMTISGGDVTAYAYDDALNASTRITLSGGTIYAYSSTNDGIDSNGGLYISGGTIYAFGGTTPEGPFDCDNSTFAITGGTLFGIGGTTSTPSTSATTQPVILLGTKSYSSGAYVALSDASGNELIGATVPRTYSSAVLLVSSPDMTVGSSYTFTSGGSTLQTVSQSSTIVSSGSSSGGIGGVGTNSNVGGRFGGGWW